LVRARLVAVRQGGAPAGWSWSAGRELAALARRQGSCPAGTKQNSRSSFGGGCSTDRRKRFYFRRNCFRPQVVRKIRSRPELVTTLARERVVKGTGGGQNGPSIRAEFNGHPQTTSLLTQRAGDIYIADTWNNRAVRQDQRPDRLDPNVSREKRAAKGFFSGRRPATQDDLRGNLLPALGTKMEPKHLIWGRS